MVPLTDISTLMYVSVPAANLRKRPSEAKEGPLEDLQESQLISNELFQPVLQKRGWYYGQALEQPYYTQKGWTGYPGWVKKSELAPVTTIERPNAVIISREVHVYTRPECTDAPFLTLPLGSKVYAETEPGSDSPPSYKVHLHSGAGGWILRESLRFFAGLGTVSLSNEVIREVVKNSFLFIGVPYGWGGMRAFSADILDPTSRAVSGVDCSSLVHLSYRLSGIEIPRNARDQWIWAQPIQRRRVLAGDLVFIAREHEPKTIRHVMICTGQESLIEASETGRTVSETSFAEKFGRSYEELKRTGFVAGERRIYFGRITRGLGNKTLHHPFLR